MLYRSPEVSHLIIVRFQQHPWYARHQLYWEDDTDSSLGEANLLYKLSIVWKQECQCASEALVKQAGFEWAWAEPVRADKPCPLQQTEVEAAATLHHWPLQGLQVIAYVTLLLVQNWGGVCSQLRILTTKNHSLIFLGRKKKLILNYWMLFHTVLLDYQDFKQDLSISSNNKSIFLLTTWTVLSVCEHLINTLLYSVTSWYNFSRFLSWVNKQSKIAQRVRQLFPVLLIDGVVTHIRYCMACKACTDSQGPDTPASFLRLLQTPPCCTFASGLKVNLVKAVCPTRETELSTSFHLHHHRSQSLRSHSSNWFSTYSLMCRCKCNMQV